MPPKSKSSAGRKKKSVEEKSEGVPTAGEDYRYGKVTKMLGDRRFMALCSDNMERLCHIPRKFKGKKFWISTGQIVLLNIRDYEDSKSDVIYVYEEKELRQLQKRGEFKVFEEKTEQEGGVVFEYEGDDGEPIDIDDL